jgi:Fic family protein
MPLIDSERYVVDPAPIGRGGLGEMYPKLMSNGRKWTPIEDLPSDWKTLADSPTEALIQTWLDTAGELRKTDAFSQFLLKLRREWAIETGVLERLYSLSDGVTKTLIEQGLDAALISHDEAPNPEHVVAMIKDQYTAIEGLYEFISDQRPLSIHYIRQLHQVLTANQDTYEGRDQFDNLVTVPMIHGSWKVTPNHVDLPDGTRFEYCPLEHVESEMAALIELHATHTALGIPAEIEAAWIHHRFTLIHPFCDGNGRVARCLATLIYLKANWFPLVVTRREKDSYIAAIRKADSGDLAPLIAVFGTLQRQAVRHALSLSEEVQREKAAVASILATVKRKLQVRDKEKDTLYRRAVTISEALHHKARERFFDVAKEINDALVQRDHVNPAAVLSADIHDTKRAAYNGVQVASCAKQLGYFANLQLFPAWVEMRIDAGTQTRILLAFHGIGHVWSGVIAAAPMAYKKQKAEDGRLQVSELKPLTSQPFEITFNDDPIEIEHRFGAWLEDCILVGLAFWQESV